MSAHSVRFHFFFFFFNLLITVVYFKAQTVEVDFGTMADAGGGWQSSGGSPRGEGRWGPLAGLLSECSWQPEVATDAPRWSGTDGEGIVETAQITHLGFKDLFVLLQSRLSKDAPLRRAAVTLKTSESGDFHSPAASASDPVGSFDRLDRFDPPSQRQTGPDAPSAVLPRSSTEPSRHLRRDASVPAKGKRDSELVSSSASTPIGLKSGIFMFCQRERKRSSDGLNAQTHLEQDVDETPRSLLPGWFSVFFFTICHLLCESEGKMFHR